MKCHTADGALPPSQIALHMERNDKLCSPGSSSIKTYVNITVEAHSSKAVTFSAVPMETGPIPIKIRLYDIENEDSSDAIEKILNVRVSIQKISGKITTTKN